MRTHDRACSRRLRGRFAITVSAGLAAGFLCSAAASVTPERQIELESLLQQDCGSCHGLTLQGGLGSPLTTDALADKSADYLFASIRAGLPGTPMPPWSGILADDEIRWLAERLLNGAELSP